MTTTFTVYVKSRDAAQCGYLQPNGAVTMKRETARTFTSETGAERVIRTRGWPVSTDMPLGSRPNAYVAH